MANYNLFEGEKIEAYIRVPQTPHGKTQVFYDVPKAGRKISPVQAVEAISYKRKS